MHHKVYQKTLHCTTPHSYFLADSLWRKWTRFLWPSGIYTVIKYFTHSPRPRPKSGNDERILQIALDGTQGIAHAKAKVSNAHWRGPTFEMCGWKYYNFTWSSSFSCAKRWRFRAARAECSFSSVSPARRPPPTHSRRGRSGDPWIRWVF